MAPESLRLLQNTREVLMFTFSVFTCHCLTNIGRRGVLRVLLLGLDTSKGHAIVI